MNFHCELFQSTVAMTLMRNNKFIFHDNSHITMITRKGRRAQWSAKHTPWLHELKQLRVRGVQPIFFVVNFLISVLQNIMRFTQHYLFRTLAYHKLWAGFTPWETPALPINNQKNRGFLFSLQFTQFIAPISKHILHWKFHSKHFTRTDKHALCIYKWSC